MSGHGELGDSYSEVISRIMTMFSPVFVSLTGVKRRRKKMKSQKRKKGTDKNGKRRWRGQVWCCGPIASSVLDAE